MEYSTSNGLTFKINEDGTITKIGGLDNVSNKDASIDTEKPSISKFYLSSDTLKCGDTILMHWAIEGSVRNVLTLRQGNSEVSDEIPDTGTLNIVSDISTENITIDIESSNDVGKVYARRQVLVNKRDNTFKNENSGFVIAMYWLFIILFSIGIICRMIGWFVD